MINTEEREYSKNLRDRLTRKAEDDPKFLAFALATWRRHQSNEPESILNCAREELWRVALVPTPDPGPKFAWKVRCISAAFSLSGSGLAQILRFAQAIQIFANAKEQGMLRAARSSDDEHDQ